MKSNSIMIITYNYMIELVGKYTKAIIYAETIEEGVYS